MRKIILALSTCVLSGSAFAQPTVQQAFNYTTGDSMSYITCDTMGFAAGTAGPNKNWQFGHLVALDGWWMKIIPTTSAAYPDSFPTATSVALYSDGSQVYSRQANNGCYTTGVSHDTILIKYPVAQLTMPRPVSMGTNITEPFTCAYKAGPYTVSGAGTAWHTGDAYGKLILPNASYDNVLRVRTETVQHDTLLNYPTTNIITTTEVLYQWFDTAHAAALLIADSIKIETPFGNTQTTRVSYLANPAKLSIAVTPRSLHYTAVISQDDLMIDADFKNGEQYLVQLHNSTGEPVLNEQFRAHGSRYTMHAGRRLPAGIYIVTLSSHTIPPGVLKIYKNE